MAFTDWFEGDVIAELGGEALPELEEGGDTAPREADETAPTASTKTHCQYKDHLREYFLKKIK